eukprot:3110467-Pyramimonas_sp.AAC.3
MDDTLPQYPLGGACASTFVASTGLYPQMLGALRGVVDVSRMWDEDALPRILYRKVCLGIGLQSVCLWPDKMLFQRGDVTVVKSSSFIQLRFHDQVRPDKRLISTACDFSTDVLRYTLQVATSGLGFEPHNAHVEPGGNRA